MGLWGCENGGWMGLWGCENGGWMGLGAVRMWVGRAYGM